MAKSCSIDGCEKPAKCRGWCGRHYQRWYKWGDPLFGGARNLPDTTAQCLWCGKEIVFRPHKKRKFCSQGCFGKASAAPRPKRIVTKHGYVQLWMPEHSNAQRGGYLFEHRYVMAEYLGRPLLSSEAVHHRNGIKDDNRIENLEVMGRMEHMKLHRHDRYRPTHCKHGHPFDKANTAFRPDGRRRCRACSERRWKAQRARRDATKA